MLVRKNVLVQLVATTPTNNQAERSLRLVVIMRNQGNQRTQQVTALVKLPSPTEQGPTTLRTTETGRMRAEMPDLIILLPGITGSVLTRKGEVLWGYSGKLVGTVVLTQGKTLRKALSLQEDSQDAEVLSDDIVADRLSPDLHLRPRIWKIDGYTQIRVAIEKKFEVAAGVNLFEFPYDWRRDNRAAAQRLARQAHGWLKKWKDAGHAGAKLILVAHSMGGLVARYFLEVLDGWKNTRALFTFGTPFRGSLNALDALANGMKKGPLGLIDLSEMVRTFTSMYQLLPIYPAYDPGDGTLVRIGETRGIPNLDPVKAQDALAFHHSIAQAAKRNRADPKWEELGYQIYPIVGVDQETYQTGRLQDGGVNLSNLYKGKVLSGDGTVPRISAIPIEFDDAPAPPGRMYAATKHGSLQNADTTLTQLASQIQDLYLDFGAFRTVKSSGPSVSLQVEDLYYHNEPIRVRARADEPLSLTAALFDPATDEPVQQISLAPDTDGWQSGAFTPPRVGYYRVRVDGPSVIQPAEDAVAVGEATSVSAS